MVIKPGQQNRQAAPAVSEHSVLYGRLVIFDSRMYFCFIYLYKCEENLHFASQYSVFSAYIIIIIISV